MGTYGLGARRAKRPAWSAAACGLVMLAWALSAISGCQDETATTPRNSTVAHDTAPAGIETPARAAPAKQPVAADEAVSSETLARVGNRTITTEEFEAALVLLPGRRWRTHHGGGPRAELERMIDLLVAEDIGKRRGLTDDPQYRRRLAAIRARAARQERELLYNLLRQHLMQEVQISEVALRQRYDAVKQRFLTTRLHLRHLVVDNAEDARAAQQRLEAGEAFGEVAAALSSDPVLRSTGGDTGPLLLEDIPPALRGKALSLKAPGDRSGPFQVQDTWHILQLVERQAGVPRSFAELRPQLEHELRRAQAHTKFQQLLDEQRRALGVEINERTLAAFEPAAPPPAATLTKHVKPLPRPRRPADQKSGTPPPQPRRLGAH